jgi:hypothetical protein
LCALRGYGSTLAKPHGDAKLADLLRALVECPKAGSASVHDRCKAVYERL